MDSDCETTEDLDFGIKDRVEFIPKAKEKYIGKKGKPKPVDRSCLKETIANAFLDNHTAQRFTAFFITKTDVFFEGTVTLACY